MTSDEQLVTAEAEERQAAQKRFEAFRPQWKYRVEIDASCFQISRQLANITPEEYRKLRGTIPYMIDLSVPQDMWCYNFHGVVVVEEGSLNTLVYPLYLTPNDWAILESGIVLPDWQAK